MNTSETLDTVFALQAWFAPQESLIISQDDIDKFRNGIISNEELRISILSDDKEIKGRKQLWTKKYNRKTQGNAAISIENYLRLHGLVDKNQSKFKKVWAKKWPEVVRWCTPQEREYIKSATAIGMGKTIELQRLALVKNNSVINTFSAVGTGLYTSKEIMDDLLKQAHISESGADSVFITHNHFDEFEGCLFPSTLAFNPESLVWSGSLSRDDIDYVDNLKSSISRPEQRIFINVINSRGLTFAYEAGKSEPRDWETDI